MSNAEKAREVLERGATRRGTWSPKEGSRSLRVYKWWRARSDDVRWQENFCHYWRVVLLWAPLRWAAKPLLWLLALVALVAAVWLTVIFNQTVLPTVGILLGIVLMIVVSSIAFLSIVDEEFKVVWNPWLKSRPRVLRWLIQGVLWPFTMFWMGFVWMIDRLIDLHEKFDLYGRVGRWLTGAKVGESKWLSWIRPWLVFPATLVTLAVWYVWAQVILGIVLGMLLLVGAVVLIAYIGEKYDEAKEKRRRAKVDGVLRVIYEIMHPEAIHDNEQFVEWRMGYVVMCEDAHWPRGIYELSIEQILLEMGDGYEEAFKRLGYRLPQSRRVGERTARALGATAIAANNPKRPSWHRKAWRESRDGLRLVWAFVLTKKWGICPLVDVHDER